MIGIILKWAIIGRMKAGRYPLWGVYYLRWWLATQCVLICGRGMFGLNNTLLILYYRMLGVSIGKNCRISEYTQISEYDLVEVGRDCAFDRFVRVCTYTK